MSLLSQVDKLLKEAAQNRNDSLIAELKTIKLAFESFLGIKSFYLSYEYNGNEFREQNLYIRKLNNHDVILSISYINDYIQKQKFLNNEIKEVLFQTKLKQSELESEIIQLSNILLKIHKDLYPQICFKTISLQHINHLINIRTLNQSI